VLLTAKELAARIGFSARTIRRWGSQGKIPGIRFSNRWRYHYNEVLKLANLRRRNGK
jgi:excisionase family DNA binding protein